MFHNIEYNIHFIVKFHTDQASSFIKNPAFYKNTANMDIKSVTVVCSKITNGKVTERGPKKV
jgi:hypothetical protein